MRKLWPVFPLAEKIPYKDSKGYKDATTNPQQIKASWTQRPTANIGLATGNISGVLVLDMDTPEGYYSLKELQRTYEPLPETRRSSTAHKGLHYFFAYPIDGENYASTVGLADYEGVDIRANGGYIVLPPSKLYGKLAYSWADPETPLAPAPRRPTDKGVWIEPVQVYTQEYALYVANLIHTDSRAVIKVVRYGITLASFPIKETVERVERQIARQQKQ